MKAEDREPTWIGVEIPTPTGYYRICIGINQEDGHEVSFYNEADLEEWINDSRNNPWSNEGSVVVRYGADATVFHKNHELKTSH
jgi:hypothetical protein